MNFHEYQAKDLFAAYGIPVPRGIVARTPLAAVEAARELGGDMWVVKAQVHAGGRGKAGGGNWPGAWTKSVPKPNACST